MEIYTFNTSINTLMNAIYVIGAVALAVLLFFVIKLWIHQIIAYRKDAAKFPKSLTAFFCVLALVPFIGTVGLGNLFVKSVVYDSNMENGDAMYFVGDPVLVSCDEYYYRDSFMGYKVELQIDDQIISPSNTFPEEVIMHFESNEELTIQYGIIKNDGLYIWSIETIQE